MDFCKRSENSGENRNIFGKKKVEDGKQCDSSYDLGKSRNGFLSAFDAIAAEDDIRAHGNGIHPLR
jgi:hypothetical protein